MQTRDSALAFLEKAAAYFEGRPTGGEDRAHWANVYNATNCREIAALIKESLTTADGGHCSLTRCRMRSAQDELNRLGAKI